MLNVDQVSVVGLWALGLGRYGAGPTRHWADMGAGLTWSQADMGWANAGNSV